VADVFEPYIYHTYTRCLSMYGDHSEIPGRIGIGYWQAGFRRRCEKSTRNRNRNVV